MHILLADDSKATALPIIAFLTEKGHRITFVQDGRAAVESFQAERPDLVLLDVIMPEMDGITACRQIKAISGSRWVPVMLMTSLSQQQEVIAGLDAGADDYLTKPLHLETLAARTRSMQRIAQIQDTIAGILDNVYEGVLTINGLGIVQSYNQAAERIFGYTAAEVIGRNIKMLMPTPYAENHDGYLARYLRERTPHVIGIGRKVQGRRKDGEVFTLQLAVTEVRQDDGSLFVGLVRDISEEEKARQRIEFLAMHDLLTGLPNRPHFNERLETTLQPSSNQRHAVLFIDLDGFKPINDSLGHAAGDEALQTVATRLRHHLAGNDFVARLGGDEFVAIAHNVAGPEAARMIGERLIAAISEPMTLAGQPARLGASIGIAMYPDHGDSGSAILSAADHAMYAAKRAGKGRVAVPGDAGST